MRQKSRFLMGIVVWVFSYATLWASSEQVQNSLTLIVKYDGDPLPMAVCQLPQYDLSTVSDRNGTAVFSKLPAGKCRVVVRYLGFETYEQELEIRGNAVLEIVMTETSLALEETTVVAKAIVDNPSTSYKIERQAIDHLQATSLSDVMELIPGQISFKRDLTDTGTGQLQIRTESYNGNNVWGAQVIVDGIPISSNATMDKEGEYNTTGSTSYGVDTRSIAADNIESVEVITGIPSAEYGDLTSGAVIVKTKSTQTPWQVRGKINLQGENVSLGKGFSLGHDKGILHVNFDYAHAWSEPRDKRTSYDRYNAGVTYSRRVSHLWNTKSSFSYANVWDWSGDDPDVAATGEATKNRDERMVFSHSGELSFNRPFSRSVSYAVGMTINNSHYRKSTYVSNSQGFLPILDAEETGYYQVPYETSSYYASGGTISRPRNFYAKVSNSFYKTTGPLNQNVSMGVEYRNESNQGVGYYHDDSRYPLSPKTNSRHRPFNDMPALNQINAYLQDNLTLLVNDRTLRLSAGLRYTLLQPGRTERVSSLSPRLNASFDLFNWLMLRAGYGTSYKTPGLMHLYPGKTYKDRVAVNYISQTDEAHNLVIYHTFAEQVKRSEDLKNVKSQKVEFGTDFRLPGNRLMRVTVYDDQTRNGFSAAAANGVYTANVYDATQGLIITPGEAIQVDWDNPARTDTVFYSKGLIANNNVTLNRGVEIDFQLGEIPGIRTQLFLSGAYGKTTTYTRGTKIESPTNLPIEYSVYETVPFKLVYLADTSKPYTKRMSSTLRAVCHIPELRMVATLTNKILWYTITGTAYTTKDPIGWIDTDLSYHEITQEMLDEEGYTIKGVLLSQQGSDQSDKSSRSPKTVMLSLNLTKELGRNTTVSFYTNNLFFKEPWKKTKNSYQYSKKNTGTFAFGADISFKF